MKTQFSFSAVIVKKSYINKYLGLNPAITHLHNCADLGNFTEFSRSMSVSLPTFKSVCRIKPQFILGKFDYMSIYLLNSPLKNYHKKTGFLIRIKHINAFIISLACRKESIKCL